ncbi:MAG: spermidine synthase, partial [Planctomycetota bacterium]
HRTFAAMQRGLSRDLIHQSDANRLIETVKTTSGTISVWRRGGHVFEFQQNGVALGRVSSDVRVTPQPAEDVLPSILGLTCHPQPGRVLLRGDDTGVCLRSVTHFPVQEIMALRAESELTKLAQKYTWNSQETAADEDSRVQIRHDTPMVALRDRSLKSFDVIVTALPQFAGSSQAFQYTTEFYASIRERLNSDGGVFCQRLTQSETGPTPISQVMSALMEHFGHVGVIQSVPGELILIATNRDKGLVDPEFLSRMQRDHVRQEIARTGLDWAQVAVLPFVDARDPIGIFRNDRRPKAISVRYGGFALCQPLDTLRRADKSDELRMAFAPHQVQLASTIPINDDLREAQRRLTSLQQQLEILAGMPDQPWTYRKSLRMEMQRDPRPPVEVVKNGQIVKEPHPLDELRKEYFIALGDALQTLASSASQGSADNLQAQVRAKVDALQKFASAAEPLLSHFAHFEIIRLHELARLSSVDEEFRHRLHIVFFTTPRDASVRPVISALDQLVDRPDLVRDDQERYDLLNSLVQKLIERWEARTAWEPKSALRVQNDVEKSVRVVNLAMDQMERAAAAIHVSPGDFLRRRRFVNAALITPLRDYRDQVLAHRSRLESSRGGETPTEPNTEEANDSPLLNPQGTQGISTN